MNILIIIFCSIYLLRVLLIKIAAKKSRKKFKVESNNENLPFISVVVPARNEEKNIKTCITSILNSNYPKELYEIVVVNDRSTDNTLDIITDLAKNNPNIKVCNITSDSEKRNLQGKPGAIAVGIEATLGEIIMMTDADCTVHKNWILTTANHFKENLHNNDSANKKKIGMICSYTNVKANRMFHYCQFAEWTYMHTYACAGIGMDMVLGCFGNNISITKEAYNKIGGYTNLAFSVTEDYVLLKAIFNAGFEVRYLCDTNTVVETLPVETFSEYMSQRKRWAIGGIDLGWKAFVYVASSVCLWLAIILSFIVCNYYLLVISVVLRFLGDTLILYPVFNILDIKYLKKWVPLSVCFYSLTEIILPFTLLNRTVKWKGQTFNQNKK